MLETAIAVCRLQAVVVGAVCAGTESEYKGVGCSCSTESTSAFCRLHILEPLLEAGRPVRIRDHDVLRPIWSAEALHRTHTVIRLVARLRSRLPCFPPGSPDAEMESCLAKDLASVMDDLWTTEDHVCVDCTEALRGAVIGLVELFGPAVGNMTVVTDFHRIKLPAFKRRALVLAAAELVSNCLLHAFEGHDFGQMAIVLRPVGSAHAILRVYDDGVGIAEVGKSPYRGPAAELAELLEAEVVYECRRSKGVAAQILFPVRP